MASEGQSVSAVKRVRLPFPFSVFQQRTVPAKKAPSQQVAPDSPEAMVQQAYEAMMAQAKPGDNLNFKA